MEERRKDQRHRTFKAGKIAFNRGAVIDCTVRNLSRSGARLDIADQIVIPEQFMLLIERDNLQYPCYVEWRKENQIGVSFKPKKT